MSTDGAAVSAASGPMEQLQAKRWLVLILLGAAQLMVTLDLTIVNVALRPRRRRCTSRPRIGNGP
jgi:hypothetical protein